MKIRQTTIRYLLGSLALAMAAGTWAPAGAADRAGNVVMVRGKAEIERKTGAVRAEAKAALLESDSVATQSRSRVKMLFRDDSILTIGPNSRLVIRKYLYDPKNRRAESLYELADGKLRSVVGSPGFKVTTPTAFAAARGTIFSVHYNMETGTTEISVQEGSVEVRNVDTGVAGSQVVNAGQSTTVAKDQPPTRPFPTVGAGAWRGEDGGVNLPDLGTETRGRDDLLGELQHKMAHGRLIPPIEQEPALTTTNVNLDIRFR
jgi:hypothetical protein